jgi:ribosomal-protein-alanine N-acetyltransferase
MTRVARLRTDRLVLRQAVWEDLEAVHRLMSNPRVMRYWSRPEHETVEETRSWLGYMVDQAADSRDWLIRGWRMRRWWRSSLILRQSFRR